MILRYLADRTCICGRWRPRSACTSAQPDQSLFCLLTASVNEVEYIDWQRRSWLDCMAASAGLRQRVFDRFMIKTYIIFLRLSFGPRQAKRCLRTCATCADSDHPAPAQSITRAFVLSSIGCHYGSPFIHSVVSNDSVSGQWRPWSDCADAQADLGLRCPHMPEDTFYHDAVHLICFSVCTFYKQIEKSMWLTNFSQSGYILYRSLLLVYF